MSKKCVMCGVEAEYLIKESTDAYCEECAIDCFSDLSYLQKVDEAARQLKKLVKEHIEEEIEDKLN